MPARVVHLDHQIESRLRHVTGETCDSPHPLDCKVASLSEFADEIHLEGAITLECGSHRVLRRRRRTEPATGETINCLDQIAHAVCMSKAQPAGTPPGHEKCF